MDELQKQRLMCLVERRYERTRVAPRRHRVFKLLICALFAGATFSYLLL